MLARPLPRGPAASARLLVIVMIAVVVSFVLASAISQYRQAAIDAQVGDIVGNAMPSVQYLSQARTDLRRIDEAIIQTLLARGDASPEALERVHELRRMMTSRLQSYLAMPFFPSEHALYDDIVGKSLVALDDALGRSDERSTAGDRAGVLEAMGRAHLAAVTLDEGIQRMVDYDAAQGQRLGLSIARIRQQSVSLLVLLEALTIGLAAIATVIAFRNLRRTVSLVEESRRIAEQRASTSEERATELEMFAGRVAHDLRSPLTAIAMRLSMAERQAGVDPRSALVSQLQQYVTRMNSMIEGLLAFARSGARPRPGEEANLVSVLKDAVTGLAVEAEAVGARIALEPHGPVSVACDAGMVTSVVMNLTRNAVKYIQTEPRKERRIDVRVIDGDGTVRVEVEDTGPGIPPDALGRIFDPFVRLSTEQPGIGLGLATVKRIIEAHRGRVGVESTEGVGSCFWFELPRVEAPGAQRQGLSPLMA
jgi:signal transduction histidine kinase